MLSKFIESNVNNTVWFATQGGIFQGLLKNVKHEVLTLENAFCIFGNGKIPISNVTILTECIIAWGDTIPGYCIEFD
jgi:hypothetical protein